MDNETLLNLLSGNRLLAQLLLALAARQNSGQNWPRTPYDQQTLTWRGVTSPITGDWGGYNPQRVPYGETAPSILDILRVFGQAAMYGTGDAIKKVGSVPGISHVVDILEKLFGGGGDRNFATFKNPNFPVGPPPPPVNPNQELIDFLNSFGVANTRAMLNAVGYQGTGLPTDMDEIRTALRLGDAVLSQKLSQRRPIARMVGGYPMYVPYDPNYARTANYHWLSML